MNRETATDDVTATAGENESQTFDPSFGRTVVLTVVRQYDQRSLATFAGGLP